MEKQDTLDFENISINNGFLKQLQTTAAHNTVKAVYDRFVETKRFEALKCQPISETKVTPHIFWDSDVFKWIEGVAYITSLERSPELEKLVDDAVSNIEKSVGKDGYFNSHFLVTEQDQRFQGRDNHELYCAGHMMEAAVAYAKATGKEKLLTIAKRYADLIYQVFYIEHSAAFTTCGHPEIELALARLYEYTGCKKYYDLGIFFVDMRGNNEKDKHFLTTEGITKPRNSQSHLPAREQHTAEGHSVRACYFYCAMADFARLSNDKELFKACHDIFQDICNKKMYITGGIGSTFRGEAFTVDYDLNPKNAYAETCASIALAMFAGRMQKLEMDSVYADVIEREIYNGACSGMSLDGTSFFYENPLELDPFYHDMNPDVDREAHEAITERVKVFYCSCCPPNLVRFYPSIGEYFFSYTRDCFFIHQYASCTASIGKENFVMETFYPADGNIKIRIPAQFAHVAVRIPGWCDDFSLNCKYILKQGYAYFDNPQDDVELILNMKVKLYEANPKVHTCAQKVCVMRGPVVYCAEGVDNGADLSSIRLLTEEDFRETSCKAYPIPNLEVTAQKKESMEALYQEYHSSSVKVTLKLIPFFAHANRGSTEMMVWLTTDKL